MHGSAYIIPCSIIFWIQLSLLLFYPHPPVFLAGKLCLSHACGSQRLVLAKLRHHRDCLFASGRCGRGSTSIYLIPWSGGNVKKKIIKKILQSGLCGRPLGRMGQERMRIKRQKKRHGTQGPSSAGRSHSVRGRVKRCVGNMGAKPKETPSPPCTNKWSGDKAFERQDRKKAAV